IPSCSEGSQLLLKVINPSRDDAGNYFDYIKGNPKLLVKCDPNPPVIREVNITSDDSISEDIFIAGDTVNIKAMVEDYSDVKLVINASEFGVNQEIKSDCVSISGSRSRECRLTFTIGREGPYTGEIKIRAIDRAGNIDETTQTISVDKGVRQEIVDIWSISGSEHYPQRVSAPILAKNSQILILEIDHQLKRGMSNANIVRVEGEECKVIIDEDTDIPCFFTMSIPVGDRVVLGVELQPGEEYPDKFNVNISYRIYSKIGRSLYVNPEIESLTFKVETTYSQLAPALVKKFLEEADNKTEERKNSYINAYKTFMPLLGVLYAACMIKSSLLTIEKGTESVAAGLETSANAADATIIGAPIGEALRAISKLFGGVGKSVSNVLIKLTHIVPPMACEIGLCKFNLVEWLTDKIGFREENIIKPVLGESGVEVVSALAGEVDPYRSVPEALATTCVPAMMKHYGTMIDIQCAKNNCYKIQAVMMGGDLSVCDKQAEVQECVLILNGAQNVLFITRLWDQLMVNLEYSFNHPVALAYFGINLLIQWRGCNAIPFSTVRLACKIPLWTGRALEDISNIKALYDEYQTLKSFFVPPKVCEEKIDLNKITMKKGREIKRLKTGVFHPTQWGDLLLMNEINDVDPGEGFFYSLGEVATSSEKTNIGLATGPKNKIYLVKGSVDESGNKRIEIIGSKDIVKGIAEYEREKAVENYLEELELRKSFLILATSFTEDYYFKEQIQDLDSEISELEKKKREVDNSVLSILEQEHPFIYQNQRLVKAREEYRKTYEEYLQLENRVREERKTVKELCDYPKSKSCKEARKQLSNLENELKRKRREMKEKEQELGDSIKSAIDDYYYIQWRNQPTLKWISDLYQMSLSVSMYFDQLTRGFGKEFTWANLNLHQFTLERGIEKLCEDKLNSLDESELVLSQSQYVAPIGNPGATIVAYRIPNYDYNEDNEGVELVNYTYYVSYYLSNNDPLLGNRKPEMHFKIVLRPGEKILKDEKLEYGENSVVSETLSEVSGRQYSEACIIINNGNNFFDSYHGGLCTRIRGVGE
ncbi:hypothetical protein J7K74_01165, partial [Candidatus Woesearchaeota archaeon]|nr:hypothetical protein [Candidatus Woesearchaeota archaeon]